MGAKNKKLILDEAFPGGWVGLLVMEDEVRLTNSRGTSPFVIVKFGNFTWPGLRLVLE